MTQNCRKAEESNTSKVVPFKLNVIKMSMNKDAKRENIKSPQHKKYNSLKKLIFDDCFRLNHFGYY